LRSESLAELCEELLSGRGEASGVALAGEILAKYSELTTGPRVAFFEALATRFGHDRDKLEAPSRRGRPIRRTRRPRPCTAPPSPGARSCCVASIWRRAEPLR
jgi:hypothetical protein